MDQFSLLSSLNSQQSEEFNNTRTRLYKEEELLSERLRMAAGVKWREQGERSNKYFLNLVNTNRARTTIDYLSTTEGNVNNIKDILDHAKAFYSKLYSKQTTSETDEFFQHCPNISNSAREDLKKALTITDLKTALKSCKDSTPGLDGIPYSYYKIFGNQLLPLVLESWQYSSVTGKLPQSQSTSVISLIPKIGKDKHYIKNWRPISLSSCDLKIITKAYSTKVSSHLSEIIIDSQMGYIPGRDINFNNRLMRAALEHCRTNDMDYALISLDAQKAYDSVDHEYISKTLSAYGFPTEFISAVNILHGNLFAQVQINGFLSDSFTIQRGVKQGDALSCALFIIAIDPLIRNIENNQNIPSLKLTNNCTIKTLAYADDIAIITHNKNECINNSFDEYMKLTNASGLTLNADKTEILNLCTSEKRNTVALYQGERIDIDHKPSITVCGNLLSLDDKVSYEVNVIDKINKLNKQLNRWKARYLTINGKMIIVKTFAISQLIFTSQFQTIRPKELKKIEHLCYSFIWNGTDRVKRCYLKSGRDEGGINGIDVESFFHSIAVRQFIKSNNFHKLSSLNDCPYIKEDIKSQARLILRKLLISQINDMDIDSPIDIEWISNIRLNLLVKSYSRAHITSCRLGITSFSSVTPELYRRGDYNQIRRVLPPKVLSILDNQRMTTTDNIHLLLKLNNKAHDIVKMPNKLLNVLIKNCLKKNLAYHPCEKFAIPKNYFSDIRHTWQHLWQIKNPVLRAIRLKVLYKDIWCLEKRHKLGITSSSLCTSCGESESAIHQLFFCHNAKRIWNIGMQIMNVNDFYYNIESFVKLIEVTNNSINEIIKSAIFKLLIQIDRSNGLSDLDIYRNIKYWISIELVAISKKYHGNHSAVVHLQSVLSCIDRLIAEQ